MGSPCNDLLFCAFSFFIRLILRRPRASQDAAPSTHASTSDPATPQVNSQTLSNSILNNSNYSPMSTPLMLSSFGLEASESVIVQLPCYFIRKLNAKKRGTLFITAKVPFHASLLSSFAITLLSLSTSALERSKVMVSRSSPSTTLRSISSKRTSAASTSRSTPRTPAKSTPTSPYRMIASFSQIFRLGIMTFSLCRKDSFSIVLDTKNECAEVMRLLGDLHEVVDAPPIEGHQDEYNPAKTVPASVFIAPFSRL